MSTRIDGRRLDNKTLEYIRKQSVRMREDSMCNEEISKVLGMGETTTSTWGGQLS